MKPMELPVLHDLDFCLKTPNRSAQSTFRASLGL
jgi:hypothetical protein